MFNSILMMAELKKLGQAHDGTCDLWPIYMMILCGNLQIEARGLHYC